MAKLEFRIYPNGMIQSKTVGVKGPSCQNYAEEIYAITGGKYYFVEKTEEFLEQEQEEMIREEIIAKGGIK